MEKNIGVYEIRILIEREGNYMEYNKNINFREHDKELIEKCIAAINKLPNCPNGHSRTYDKATIERTLRNVIDN